MQKRFLSLILLSFFLASGAYSAAFLDASPTYRLLRLPRNDGPLVKWGEPHAGSPATITYAFAKQAVTVPVDFGPCGKLKPIDIISRGHPPANFAAEIQAAFSIWEEAAGVRFVQVQDISQANILIGASGERATSLHATVGMQVGENHGEFTTLKKSVVCLNPDRTWTLKLEGTVGEKIPLSIRLVLAHELGHTLGLDHTYNKSQLMHHLGGGKSRLSDGDLEGVRILYGMPRD
jgi:hypothetical protein